MQADEVRFLFAYDRWATRQVLEALRGLDRNFWIQPGVVGERALADVLVHHLAVSRRWRIAFQREGDGEAPGPEDQPLPTIKQLRRRWQAEWEEVDAWLPTLTDGFVGDLHAGVPVWQILVGVVDHGTQHRAEAAAVLRRPLDELDLINYAQQLAALLAASV